MKKRFTAKTKKMLAIVLVIMLALASIPMIAFAEGNEQNPDGDPGFAQNQILSLANGESRGGQIAINNNSVTDDTCSECGKSPCECEHPDDPGEPDDPGDDGGDNRIPAINGNVGNNSEVIWNSTRTGDDSNLRNSVTTQETNRNRTTVTQEQLPDASLELEANHNRYATSTASSMNYQTGVTARSAYSFDIGDKIKSTLVDSNASTAVDSSFEEELFILQYIGLANLPITDKTGNSWAVLNLILTIATALIAMTLIVANLKHKKDTEHSDDQRSNHSELFKFSSLIPMAVAIVLFFLTEDMSRKMIFTDSYTVWMMAIALIQTAIAFISTKKQSEDNDKAAEITNPYYS
jgi:hypothetical protein